jgi:hypothetical protein
MLKRTVLSALCAATLVTGVAYAQTSATLTLRSGEKVSGDLIDLGGVGYTVKVNGNERQIAQNDVAVIDFTGGSDPDWSKFTGTSQVVLRNGQTIDGSLYDIGGTNPLRLTIRSSGGEREISSNEVARIIIARPDNVATGTSGIAATPSVAGAVTVQANQAWTSTGITVRKGQRVTFTTTGQVQLSTNPEDIADANGSRQGRFAPNSPVKAASAGALVARVGNGAAFPIGASNAPVTMPANGVLYLGVNDDEFADNQGNFQVIVR